LTIEDASWGGSIMMMMIIIRRRRIRIIRKEGRKEINDKKLKID
jgi:hypothetical protein